MIYLFKKYTIIHILKGQRQTTKNYQQILLTNIFCHHNRFILLSIKLPQFAKTDHIHRNPQLHLLRNENNKTTVFSLFFLFSLLFFIFSLFSFSILEKSSISFFHIHVKKGRASQKNFPHTHNTISKKTQTHKNNKKPTHNKKTIENKRKKQKKKKEYIK